MSYLLLMKRQGHYLLITKKGGNTVRKLYTYFVLILGVAMIGLGIYLMFNPSTSLQALTIFIGIILVLNGINEVISYFGEQKY